MSMSVWVLKARMLRIGMSLLSAGRRQGRKGGNPRACEVPVVDDRWALARQNKYEGEG